ncbi:MAG: hypothetical protein HUK21_08210 [Fibrobacteraceae bacterium]|nr:hypothetical protein [Fibrobacteraceae bacterium]
MKLKVFIAAAAMLASQSFAIIGLGAHYAPNFGTKLSAMERTSIYDLQGVGSVDFSREAVSGTMHGLGFKLWVDLLPIIDIEATVNLQFASYDATLYIPSIDANGDKSYVEQPIELDLAGTPFGKATPKYVAMNGDLSITYPITWLPIIRPYIGGGLTYYMNSFVLDKPFMTKFMSATGSALLDVLNTNDPAAVAQMDPAVAEQKAKELSDALTELVKDEGLTTSIGGHALLGVRARLLIIAIYANFKYYFGGDTSKDVDAGKMALELGAGFTL